MPLLVHAFSFACCLFVAMMVVSGMRDLFDFFRESPKQRQARHFKSAEKFKERDVDTLIRRIAESAAEVENRKRLEFLCAILIIVGIMAADVVVMYTGNPIHLGAQ